MDQCCNRVEVTIRTNDSNDIQERYVGALQPIHLNSVTKKCDATHSKGKSKMGGILRRIRSKSKRIDKTSIPAESQDISSPLSICVAMSSSNGDVQSSRKGPCSTALHNKYKHLRSDGRRDSNGGNCDNEKQFFKMDDFDPATWLEVDSERNISNVGFAAIMAATVMVHPLVFVTGAATAVWAVGVFHAVEKGYELFSDGSFSHMFWADSSPVMEDGFQSKTDLIVAQNQRMKEAKQYAEEIDRANLDSNGFIKIKSESVDNEQPTTKLRSLPLLPKSGTGQPIECASSLDVAMKQHFPPLQNRIVGDLEFPGLNAIEFFEVFFSDNAPYSLKEFQETRGDIDIVYSKWKTCDKSTINPLSFHHHAMKKDQLVPLPNCIHEERTLKFRTLTKSFFGPAYASTRKMQRVTKFKLAGEELSTKLIIIENKTELFDIPFCDRFFVVERWIAETETHNPESSISNKEHNISMLSKTKLNVEVEIFMRGNCAWEKQIRSKSLSALKNGLASWGIKATQALELTVKKKLERMRDDQILSKKSLPSTPVCSSARSSSELESEALMKVHKTQLTKLEKKIKAGGAEWSNIEIRHSLNAGRGSAFAEVLDRNGLPLHKKGLQENLDIVSMKASHTSRKRIPRLLKRQSK